MKGCDQSIVWWYTHLITDSVLAVHVTMVPICNLEKMKFFSCHWVSFSDWFFCVPALTPTSLKYIFCNHFVFENATNIAFLLCYWKNKNKKQYFLSLLPKKEKNTLDPDGCILLKLVYRVDRAASQQSTAKKGLWRNSSLHQGAIIPQSLQPEAAPSGRNEHRTEL